MQRPVPLRTGRGREVTLAILALVVVAGQASAQGRHSIEGEAAGDLSGSAVAFVGDVDGDACDDFVVGAPFASIAAGVRAGRVVLFSGRTRQELNRWSGNAAGERFGTSVAAAGDFDHDGRPDVAVGRPGGADPAVLVFSGRDGSLLFSHVEREVGAEFGTSLDAGDFDGDGRDELLVGAPGGNGGTGALWILQPDAPTATRVDGQNTGDAFGSTVLALPDVDGDGRDEFVVGAPGAPGDNGVAQGGEVTVFSLLGPAAGAAVTARGWTRGDLADQQIGLSLGRARDPISAYFPNGNGLVLFAGGRGLIRVIDTLTLGGPLTARTIDGGDPSFGAAVDSIGDIDGDGSENFAVGVPGDPLGSIEPGRVLILDADDTTSTTAAVLEGTSINDAFGSALRGGGDLDGDGHADLVVGAPRADPNGTRSGATTLFDLNPIAAAWESTPATAPSGGPTLTVRSLGDRNGDGIEDVITGIAASTRASVALLDGRSGVMLDRIDLLLSELPLDRLAVAGVGDLDTDGAPDFVYRTATGIRVATGTNRGAVVGIPFEPGPPEDRFGWAISGAGDTNRDGAPDYVVGAPQASSGPGQGPGYVLVLTGVNPRVIRRLDGAVRGDSFGYAVATVGDWNGDGTDDVAVGAPADRQAGSPGAVFVYSMPDGAQLARFDGDFAGDRFGIDVAPAGDVDGDGRTDLVVGAAPSVASPGYARVFAGGTGALLLQVDAGATEFGFGIAVRGVGDLDGDGHADIAVGAPFANRYGAVRIVSGRSGADLYVLNGDSTDNQFGRSLDTIADRDGDGRRELVIATHVSGTAKLFVSDGFAPRTRAYGFACPSSVGTWPRIGTDAPAGAGAGLGESLAVRLRAAPPHTTLWLALGLGGRRQLDLTPAGMPGCALLLGDVVDLLVTSADATGRGGTSIRIPADPALAGARFQAQWLALDLFANAQALITSDALEVTVDRR
ncbi:MAG: FG-GAP repeat protein [Planctomycetes bacterium]|nr:FG-GAP repeat protein [Planctomycetota bacterium]